LLVTFEESFKCLCISLLGGNDERLFRHRTVWASNSWLCFVVHDSLQINYDTAKGEFTLNCLCATRWDKGKTRTNRADL